MPVFDAHYPTLVQATSHPPSYTGAVAQLEADKRTTSTGPLDTQILSKKQHKRTQYYKRILKHNYTSVNISTKMDD